jgi:glycosyltransferase involved in cell wall biosynthesis
LDSNTIIDVIIPVYNEADSIAYVIRDIPNDLVRNIIVCNNNSTDDTPDIARRSGAVVVDAPARGYGNACLKGMAYIADQNIKPDIVVFFYGVY